MLFLNNNKENNYLICKEMDNRFDKHYDIAGYKFQFKDFSAVSGIINNQHIIIFGNIVNSNIPMINIIFIMKILFCFILLLWQSIYLKKISISI